MEIPTWQDIKDNRYWALFDLFILLAILTILGSTFAVAVALIPVISSALALSLLPHFIVSFLVFLPFIACSALLINFLTIHWYNMFGFQPAEEKIKRYFSSLFLYFLFTLKFTFFTCVSSYFQWHFQENKRKRFNFLIDVYLFCSVLTALGLGIYFSIGILPTLISSLVVATSLPYAVVVLFAMLAAAILTTLTYDLLVLPIRLFNLVLDFKFWKDTHQYSNLFYYLAVYLVFLAGEGLTVYASYWLFPLALQSLLPLLPAATAGFMAVLICVSLVSLVMTVLPRVVHFLAEGIRVLADKGHDEPSQFTTAFKAFERGCRLRLLGAGSQLIDSEIELGADYEPSGLFGTLETQSINSQTWKRYLITGYGLVCYRAVISDGATGNTQRGPVFCSPPPGWSASKPS